MRAGYSYTTIVSGVDEPTRIEVSFRLDDAALIQVYGLDCDQPQLCVRLGGTAVDFLPTIGRITEADTRLARKLADQAAIYAADVERLYAEEQARVENEAAA